MNKLLAMILSGLLSFPIPAIAAVEFDLIKKDGSSAGTIEGTTDELDMIGGFKEGGSDTLSNSIDGNSATTTALAANGANCSTGSAPVGVDTIGAAEGCVDIQTAVEQSTHEANASVHHTKAVSADIDHDSITGVSISDHHVKAVSADIDHDSITGVSTSDHHTATVNTDAESKCTGSNLLEGSGACVASSGMGHTISKSTSTGPGSDLVDQTDRAKLAFGAGFVLDDDSGKDATYVNISTSAGFSKVWKEKETISLSGTSVEFTGLQGGRFYELRFNILQNTSNGLITVQINNDSTASRHSWNLKTLTSGDINSSSQGDTKCDLVNSGQLFDADDTGSGIFRFSTNSTDDTQTRGTSHTANNNSTPASLLNIGTCLYDGDPLTSIAIETSAGSFSGEATLMELNTIIFAVVNGQTADEVWHVDQEQNPSGASSLSFTGLDPDARYGLEIQVSHASTEGTYEIQFNGDTGANYRWATDAKASDNSDGGANSASDNQIDISASFNSSHFIDAGESFHSTLRFQTDPSDTTKVFLYHSGAGNSLVTESPQGTGFYDGASALTSIQLKVSAGTFTGSVKLMKLGTVNAVVGGSVTTPAGFTKIVSQSRVSGFITTAEQGSDSHGNANNDCFTTYGGRLPMYEEQRSAIVNFVLDDETDNSEWVAGRDGGNAQACFTGTDSTCTTTARGTSRAYRCWIPAASVVIK